MNADLFKKDKIFVYAINLPIRPERKTHIISQFFDKKEFELNIVSGISKYKNGAFNLWKTIQGIICNELDSNRNFFILCEDDHQFTNDYSFELLMSCIHECLKLDADILLGGVSSFQKGVQISNHLFWIEKFSGLQFTVVFRRFYKTILGSPFSYLNDVSDHKISSLTSNKFVIYPFISIQREFGYSDVTQNNSIIGTVDRLFLDSAKLMQMINKIQNFYLEDINDRYHHKFTRISVYTSELDKWKFLQDSSDFIVYPENIMCLEEVILRKIVLIELKKESQAFVLQIGKMELGHRQLSKYLFANIIDGYIKDADIILGDISNFNLAVPITQNLFWIDDFQDASFIIIFGKTYKTILDMIRARPHFNIKTFLSHNFINKMVIFPPLNRSLKKLGKSSDNNVRYLMTINSIYKKYLSRTKD